MPHIVVEYSDNLTPPQFHDCFKRLHQLIAEHVPGAKVEACKSRAYAMTDYYIGAGGEQQALVAVQLQVLAGRDLAVLQDIAKRVQAFMLEWFAADNGKGLIIEVTVNVTEIRPETYRK